MALRIRIPNVQDPDFAADVKLTGVAELRLVGTADGRTRAPLGELLVELHAELLTRAAREVIVDLQGLDTMAAACFNELVEWVARLQDVATDARYRIRFRINRSVQWQAQTLRALSCFDTELVAIDP